MAKKRGLENREGRPENHSLKKEKGDAGRRGNYPGKKIFSSEGLLPTRRYKKENSTKSRK